MYAISELPDTILEKMENVAITVEDWPSPEHLHGAPDASRYDLLGLYLGIPLTQRTPSSYNFALPDRIILYQKNIEAHSRTVEELTKQVRDTVAHEVAHHFGIGDEELRRLGL